MRRVAHSLRRLLASLALGLAACMAACTATAAPPDKTQGYRFEIVTGDDSAVSARIAEDLYKRLVPTFAAFRTELAQKRRMVTIAIGPDALRQAVARRCDCVVIAAFTSSQVWRSVVGSLPPARAALNTAVYAEPAPLDQLQLASLLYRRPVRVAAIVGQDADTFVHALQGKADLVRAAASDDIGELLGRIGRSEALLALPDSAVYNPENVRSILLATYRRKQAVIGFSGDMVKVGALATTYSDIEDINAQVAEVAAAFVASGELPAPQFPRYFRTTINEGVARSLDIVVGKDARNFARPRP